MNIVANGLNCQITFSGADNEDWRRATVSIVVPNFEGSFSCEVQTSEIDALAERLRKLEKSIGHEESIEWCNLEDNIRFILKLNALGGIEGEYQFSPNVLSIGPTLAGEFSADQSYLSGWIHQLGLATSVDS